MLSNRDYCNILLETKAVNFNFEKPFEFASGLKSPIYCDNRLLLGYPEIQQKISQNLKELVNILETHPKTIIEKTDYTHIHTTQENNTNVDIIVGVATAGISWATLGAFHLEKPLSYARAKEKEHGKKSQFEGADITNKSVIIIEDVVSSASSVLKIVQACREQNATVTTVISLFTYNFTYSKEKFLNTKCPYISIASFEILAKTSLETHIINQTQYTQLLEWHNNINATHS